MPSRISKKEQVNSHVTESIIHLLDEETVSHIAAGEVVERPASVVKELVENAIDAGALRIRIAVKSDGSAVRQITVTDDGCGMSPEDATTAFRQHATSKIRQADDLFAITTLGFRGEALASIAAVSEITLTTRRAEDIAGTRVTLSGGMITDSSESGAPPGTTIEIQSLFFNTPARRKFLRTVSTELAHIFDHVERIALAHPGIAFHLLHQDKEKFHTSGRGDILETIQDLFGAERARNLIRLDPVQGHIPVSGYVAYPLPGQRSRRSLYISVNGRQIVSQPLIRAIREGFGVSLQKGEYPFAVLDVRIDSNELDVNVHPTKREVRFSSERQVTDSVRESVKRAILQTDGLFPAAPAQVKSSASSVSGRQTETEYPVSRVSEGAATYGRTDRQLRQTGITSIPALSPSSEGDPSLPTILGQLYGTYILAESDIGDLLIIDQHAAHEKIVYEALQKKKEDLIESQQLLIPVTVRLSRRDGAIIHDAARDLGLAGFAIEDFGGDTWAIRAVPAGWKKLDDPDEIRSLLQEIIDGIQGPATDRQSRICTTIACRTAIKGNTLLSREQMERLVGQLYSLHPPYTCPHGRPAIIRYSKIDLEHLFRRR